MSGADILVQVLADEGVDIVFGYSGGAILPTYDAIFVYNQQRSDATQGFKGTPCRGWRVGWGALLALPRPLGHGAVRRRPMFRHGRLLAGGRRILARAAAPGEPASVGLPSMLQCVLTARETGR